MNELLFLKLGGSLITDKTGVESVKKPVIDRIVTEIKNASLINPDIKLVLGHGSGSFGHVAAAKHNTRQGVNSGEQWYAFAGVSSAAARLNTIVREALLAVEISAVTIQPSASAECIDGKIVAMSTSAVEAALSAGLIPIVYGDVAFDHSRGGTIISTEEIFIHLAQTLQPEWILLAGESDGVLDAEQKTISLINHRNRSEIMGVVGGSRGTDVTGGMASKVQSMMDLVNNSTNLQVRIFSGVEIGVIEQLLIEPELTVGTLLRKV